MRYFNLLLLSFCLVSGPAFAAAGGKAVPEVVVRADQNKTSLTSPGYSEAKEAIGKVAGGVNLVKGDSYKTGRVSTLQDAIGFQPGVFVQPRFGAEEARLSIRGSGLQRTFHMRGIKLLQDGIPINLADGGGDFQAVDPLALDYIEVYRGANALEYGSTTLGGAINFVTPTGYTAPPFQARFELGGFNYLREQVSSGEVLGPVDYYVSLSEVRQDGFRNHADQWNRRFLSNYGLKINENAETRFYVNVMGSKSKLPGTLTSAQMQQNPKQPAAAQLSGNQKRDYDLVQIGNKTVFRWDNQSFQIGSFYFYKDLFHPIFQVLDQVSHDFGFSFKYQNLTDLLEHKNILTLGFNPVWNLMEDTRHVNSGGNRGALTAYSRQRSSNYDFFGEEQFYVLDKLALVAGLQWSLASRRYRDKFLSDGDHSGKPNYVGVSPKAGMRYEVTEHSQLFVNFSRSFEPPSFGELTNITGGGLLGLEAQEAGTLEIGTRGEEGRMSWDAAWYFARVTHELLSMNDGNGVPLGTVNAHHTRHQGAELGAAIDVLRGIFAKGSAEIPAQAGQGIDLADTLFGFTPERRGQDRLVVHLIYNWSRFQYAGDPVYGSNSLPGIPEHYSKAELVYEHPSGFYFGPNVEWSMTGYPVDMNNTLFTDPYALMGLKGGYRSHRGFSVFVEAKNLTDQVYAVSTSVIADARGRDSAQFYPGDGRSVISGIEFRW